MNVFGNSVRCLKDDIVLTIITNVNNNGFGSLRYAIEYANSNPGIDIISFNIPGPGPYTIQPLSAFPIITDPVVIDGYSQPGSIRATSTDPANLLIELDGSLGVPIGLNILSGNCEIRGLIINSFNEIDIQLLGPNGGNTIEGNHIGIDAGGNAKGINVIGIRIDNCPSNTIGGNNPENRNIIAASGGLEGANCLVYIDYPQSSGNVVKGNYLGVGPNGSTKIGESIVGIRINAGAHHNTVGPNNTISGNSLAGIQMEPSPSDNPNHNLIFGNLIGTNKDGNAAVPNGNGIRIFNGPTNTVGGVHPLERNIISGNLQAGIEVIFDSYDAPSGNIIAGNFIGLDASGSNPLGNGGSGIHLSSRENRIGGLTVGEGNLISGNGGFGVLLNGPSASNNQIVGNLIGTDNLGSSLVSNKDDGINIAVVPNNNISGNLLCGAGIGGVGNNGIEILDNTATRNKITGNFIGINALNTEGLGNGFNGIQIKREAHDNIIGPNNIISGNLSEGILIESDTDWGTSSANKNLITGNLIGTTSDGKNPFGNNSGIVIKDQASLNVIGPGNIISGNLQYGIRIDGNSTESNLVLEITLEQIYRDHYLLKIQ